MSDDLKPIIQSLIDLETKGWNTKNPDLFLSIIHPDMVWPWPPTADDHNPEKWEFGMGRFDRNRWQKEWQAIFDTHDLVHNHRKTIKIVISKEKDGAFAVVDIDTLWRQKETGNDFHWKGRVCKIYTKMPNNHWLLIAHTGVLSYPY